MGFHRLTVPSYFGGLPGGEDYLNNAVSGIPAVVDGPRAEGPDAGTYFVGFGEDGRSQSWNRGLAALGQNTDALDDFFHRDIAVVLQTAGASSSSPVTSFTLIDGVGVYVGKSGTASTTAGINDVFEILDSSNNEIVDPATGTPCRVTAISGATIGAGFAGPSVTITCTVSPAIPAFTNYHVIYAARRNLSNVPVDVFSLYSVRTSQEQAALTLDFMNQISRRDPTTKNILAVVGSDFETPSGVRLAKAGVMAFDVDPDFTQSGTRGFTFRMGRDTGSSSVLGKLIFNPSDPDGISRRMEIGGVGALNAFGTPGTLAFYDAQVVATGIGVSMAHTIPLSQTTDGASYTRIVGKPAPASILRSLNAKDAIIVGDGSTTFGDFNGPWAIAQAFDWWLTASPVSANGILRIRVTGQAGTVYTMIGSAARAVGPNTLVIESDPGVVIVSSMTGGAAMFSGGVVTFKNCNVEGADANQWIEVTGNFKSYGSAFSNFQIRVNNAGGNSLSSDPTFTVPFLIGPIGACILDIRDSYLLNNETGATANAQALIQINVSDGLLHRGFYFENSKFGATDNNAVLRISSTAIATSRVQDITFRDCVIFTRSTTTVGGSPAANCGMIAIDPGSSYYLTVDDIQILGCKIFANVTSGAQSTLLHLFGVNYAYTGYPNPNASILRVTLKNNEWILPNCASAFVPFAIDCFHLTVVGDKFRLCPEHSYGTVPTFMGWLYEGSGTPTQGKYGAINFSASNSVPINSEVLGDENAELYIKDIYLYGLNSLCASAPHGAGELSIRMPSHSGTVSGVTLDRPHDAGTGFMPEYRAYLVGNDRATFDRVIWGGNGGSSNFNWAYNGVIAVLGGQRCVLSNSGVKYPDIGCVAAEIGIRILGSTNIDINDCFVFGGGKGVLFDIDFAGHVNFSGGDFSNNTKYGIYINVTTGSTFNMSGVRCNSNGDYGLYVFSAYAAGFFTNIAGCTFWANNGNAAAEQVKFESTSANAITGCFYGNTAWAGGAAGVRFVKSGVAGLPASSSTTWGNFHGAETGYYNGLSTGTPGSQTWQEFTSGQTMVHNLAMLLNT